MFVLVCASVASERASERDLVEVYLVNDSRVIFSVAAGFTLKYVWLKILSDKTEKNLLNF